MLTTLYRIIAVISAVALVSLTLLTTADVVARYAMSAPIHAAMEGISYLLALLILAGYGLVTRDRTHIAVGILPEIFPGSPKWSGTSPRFSRWAARFSSHGCSGNRPAATLRAARWARLSLFRLAGSSSA